MQTETTTTQRRPRGRKDAQGQETVIELDPIRERVGELESLYAQKRAAANAFNDAVKSAAEASGLLSSAVRKFIVARAADKVADEQRKSAQLQLLFSDVV